ncbi:hypothetical protein [Thermocrinis sp.]|uniref:hypothetical protein n=1 Tax=Thermocrinis sp. TaxID=2024383 RepID=UPI003C0E504A
MLILILSILFGEEIRLIIDGTILRVANRLYLLTFRVMLLGIVSSGSPRCLDNFSPKVSSIY